MTALHLLAHLIMRPQRLPRALPRRNPLAHTPRRHASDGHAAVLRLHLGRDVVVEVTHPDDVVELRVQLELVAAELPAELVGKLPVLRALLGDLVPLLGHVDGDHREGRVEAAQGKGGAALGKTTTDCICDLNK